MKKKEMKTKVMAVAMSATMAASICPAVPAMAVTKDQVAKDGTYTKTAHVTRTEDDDEDEWKDNLNKDEFNNLISQIKLCNGIVFQGGGACDNYEMIVAKYCYDNDIPTIGICCGQNVMVRALGGTTKLIPNPEKHNDIYSTYVHTVKLDTNSRLYKIIGKTEIEVNSRHKKQ